MFAEACLSAAWNGPIGAALVALVMAKYFVGPIVGVWPSGDLGVLAASASAVASAAAAAVLAVAVADAAVQAAAAVFLVAAAVHGVAAFLVAVAVVAAAVSVPGVAAFVAVVFAVVVVVVVVVVAAAVRTAAVVAFVVVVDVVHAAASVGFGFVAVLGVHCVAAVWVGIDVAFQWASRIVAADAALGEEVNSVAIAVEAAGNGEQVGHPLVADPVTAVLVHVGPLQMGKHCCTA